MMEQMKRFTNAVQRRLNLPRDVKKRVMSDFVSSLEARLEAGQTVDEIYAELGSPKKVAAELNEQMKDYAYTKSPWRWLCLGVAALGGVLLLFDGVTGLLAYLLTRSVNQAGSVGIIGGSDGPTAIFVTGAASSSDTVVWAILVGMGLLGFWCLSRCKQK